MEIQNLQSTLLELYKQKHLVDPSSAQILDEQTSMEHQRQYQLRRNEYQWIHEGNWAHEEVSRLT